MYGEMYIQSDTLVTALIDFAKGMIRKIVKIWFYGKVVEYFLFKIEITLNLNL